MAGSAYKPLQPGRRPGGKPGRVPRFRVLVHRQYLDHYNRLIEAVGLKQAQEFWDHISTTPDIKPDTAATCFLRGKAGLPKGPGWSRTVHYEISSMARIDYQYHKNFKTSEDADPHGVVAILAINLSSH